MAYLHLDLTGKTLVFPVSRWYWLKENHDLPQLARRRQAIREFLSSDLGASSKTSWNYWKAPAKAITSGVSYYSALLIYAELGEIDRFDEAKQVVSYAGLNPVIRESGDSRFEGSISKRGSGRMRWILVQSAHTAVHTCHDEYLSRFYDRLEGRKGSKKAIVATARKLLVSIFHMFDRKEVYDPPGVTA